MQRIGIVYRSDHPEAVALQERATRLLEQRGLDTWSYGTGHGHLELHDLPASDTVIVMGGDGTILSAARWFAGTGTPLLGVNFGHVGFLTELEPGDLEAELPAYLDGHFWMDERAMIAATLRLDGHEERLVALNDVVVARGAEPRVIRLKLWVNDYEYTTLTADGVIVATATGSTAYNLAAGGPILHPSVRGTVMTPIAPHLAADRPLVLEPEAQVRLELMEASGAAILSADGQINRQVAVTDSVSVAISPHVTRFLRRRPRGHFYNILSAKLGER